VDDYALWSYQRSRVYEGPGTVVLLGASRMRFGFSTTEFRRRFPSNPVVQLSVLGMHPMATLRDLANDDEFTGLVVCSVAAVSFFTSTWEDQEPYVRHFHEGWNLNRQVSTFIASRLQERLAILNPVVAPMTVARRFRGAGTQPYPVTRRADRSMYLDYTLVPDTDSHRKELYWDRFAAVTLASTVHFQDVAELERIDPIDGAHFDYRDTAAFTAALAEVLVQNGVLERDSGGEPE